MADLFAGAASKIATRMADLTSVEVVSFKGSITFRNTPDGTKAFSELKLEDLGNLLPSKEMRVIGYSKCFIDGDAVSYFDSNASTSDVDQHNALLKTAVAKHDALIAAFSEALRNALTTPGPA